MEYKVTEYLLFYSQITDLSLLFHLDDVVQKLIKRYKLEGEIKVKRFVRTYAEMHMASCGYQVICVKPTKRSY